MNIWLFLAALLAAGLVGLMWRSHRQNKRRPALAKTPSEQADKANIRAGICPDCGQKKLLEGPGGGMSLNIACDNCLSEFNVGFGFHGEIFLFERMGKLTYARARLYGIGPEQVAISLDNPQ